MAGSNAIRNIRNYCSDGMFEHLECESGYLKLNMINVHRTINTYRITHNNWLNNTKFVGYYMLHFWDQYFANV